MRISSGLHAKDLARILSPTPDPKTMSMEPLTYVTCQGGACNCYRICSVKEDNFFTSSKREEQRIRGTHPKKSDFSLPTAYEVLDRLHPSYYRWQGRMPGRKDSLEEFKKEKREG